MCGKIHTLYKRTCNRLKKLVLIPLVFKSPSLDHHPFVQKSNSPRIVFWHLKKSKESNCWKCPGKALLNIELLNADDLRLASATDTVENVTIRNMMSVYELSNSSKQLMSKTSISFQWHDKNKMRSEKKHRKRLEADSMGCRLQSGIWMSSSLSRGILLRNRKDCHGIFENYSPCKKYGPMERDWSEFYREQIVGQRNE